MYSRVCPQRFVISALFVASICAQQLGGTLQSEGAAQSKETPREGNVPSSEVSRLLKELASPDDQVRWQSLLQLQAVTPISSTAVAVPAVIHALMSDSSPAVRGQAAEALSHLPYSDASIKALFSVLNDPQEDIRWRAANSIPAKKRFLPYIIRALKNQDWEVETRMLAKIETLGGEAVSAVPALTQELADANPVVRAGAARALLKIGAAAYAAGPALMTALRKEQDPVARSCEVRALVRTGGATASDISDLVRLLKDDADPSTRYNTAKIIGNLGSVAQPAITDLVITMNNDANSLVRCYCAEALGNIGPGAQPAIPDLVRFLEDRLKENYRHQAAVALGKIAPANDPKVTKVLLVALMDNKSSDVKAYAARGLALMHSQDPRVVPALQSLASDADAKLRRAASESLKQLALEAEVKSVDEGRNVDLTALSSKDALVRFSALRKLKALLQTRPNEAPAYVAVDEDPDLISRLTKILSDSDPSNRALAAESLGLMGSKAQAAIPALLVQLSSADHASARCAARALATVGAGNSSVIAELTRLLAAGGVGVDAYADALASMGKPAVRGLIVGVEASPMSAYYASQALGNMGAVAKDAVAALIAVVEDAKTPPATRAQALDALGKVDPNNPVVADLLKKLAPEKRP